MVQAAGMMLETLVYQSDDFPGEGVRGKGQWRRNFRRTMAAKGLAVGFIIIPQAAHGFILRSRRIRRERRI